MPLDDDKTLLMNIETGQEEPVPKTKVAEYLGKGTHKISSDLIPMVTADNQKISADPREVDQYISEGGRVATEKDITTEATRQAIAKDPMATVEAGLLGATEGIIPVLPTLYAETIGGRSPEYLKQLKEEKAGVYGISQAAGLLGSAGLASLGKGAVKTAAEYLPVNLISKAGKAVGEITEKALAEKIGALASIVPKAATKELMQKAISNMAAVGTEGALWGGIQGLDETALGDTDKAAENILYGAGWGTIFGLGLGFAPTVLKGLAAAGKYGIEDAFPYLSSRVSGKPLSDIKEAVHGAFSDEGMAFRKGMTELSHPDDFNAAISTTAEKFQSVHDLANEQKKVMYDNSPLAKTLANIDKTKYIDAANDLADRAQKHLNAIKDKTSVYDESLMKAAQEKIDDFRHAVTENWQSQRMGIENPALNMHTAANETKRSLDNIINWEKGEEKNYLKKVTKGSLKSLRGMFDDFTTDKKLFGDAAMIHGEQNRLFANYIASNREYEKAFTNKLTTMTTDPKTGRLIVNEVKAPTVDENKIKRFFNSFYSSEDTVYNYNKYYNDTLGGKVLGKNQIPIFINEPVYVKVSGKQVVNPKIFENLSGFDKTAYDAASPLKQKQMLNNAKISFTRSKDLRRVTVFDNMVRSASEMQAYNKQMQLGGKYTSKYSAPIVDAASSINKNLAQSTGVRKLFQPNRYVSTSEAVGAGIGAAALGIPTTLGAATVYHLLKNPRTIIGLLSKAESGYKLFKAGYEAIPKAARDIGQKAVKKLTVAEGALQTAKGNHSFDSSKAYEKNSKEIKDYKNNPNLLTQKLSIALSEISDSAPQLAMKLQGVAASGINFLYSKLPQLGMQNNGWLQSDKEIEPSAQEKSEWLRYFKAVTEPKSVLEDAQNGIITDEGIETFKTVYPNLLDDLRMGIMEHIAKEGKEPDYKTRLVLDKFFDNQIDAANNIEFMQFIQGLNQQAANKEAQKPKMGTKPIDVVSSQHRSASDKLLTRR